MCLRITPPKPEHESAYWTLLDDFAGEKIVPGAINDRGAGYRELLEKIEQGRASSDMSEDKVSSTTYFFFNEKDDLVGASDLRHRLNASLKVIGGHIGYGVGISHRRKGYATEILRLTLLEAERLGIDRVLLTCDKDNVASRKTILKNGGQFDSEAFVEEHDAQIERYTIDLKS